MNISIDSKLAGCVCVNESGLLSIFSRGYAFNVKKHFEKKHQKGYGDVIWANIHEQTVTWVYLDERVNPSFTSKNETHSIYVPTWEISSVILPTRKIVFLSY